MEKENKKFIEVKCPNCAHVQKSKSELIWITCSSCRNKFEKLKNIVVPEGQKKL